MGAGFVRRYGDTPTDEALLQIEGVAIIDAAPPAPIQGVGTGVTCVVGEFSDMSYAVAVDTSGNVTTSPRVVDLISGADMVAKVGGFDETIGQFGGDGGNGFAAVRPHAYSRLTAAVVNLASDKAVRLWRDLPTCKSSTDPTPIVPLAPGSVVAGREFKVSSDRVRVAKRVAFTDAAERARGTDANTTTAVAAATQTIAMASGNFLLLGALKGDILVLGVLGGAGYLGSNAGTYRVVSVDSATQLTIQKLDGTNFATTDEASSAQPWRLYPAEVADTGGQNALADLAGYSVPARPLTNGSGSSATDGSIAAATSLTPVLVPAAGSATTWDTLSGLTMRTHPTGALAYAAAVQAPNAANSAGLNSLYASALAALDKDDLPAREVNIVFAARQSRGIGNALRVHVVLHNAVGVGRVAVVSPGLDLQTTSAAVAEATGTATDSAFGVGATDGSGRDESVIYAWPGQRTLVPDARNFSVKVADGTFVTDGTLDLPSDARLAAVMSVLAPERNPGEVTATTQAAMATVLGFQRGVSGFTIADYVLLRQRGVVALRIDQQSGPLFQSGVTTSLVAGRTTIARRRFSFFVQDSVAARLNLYAKQPLTDQLKDTIVGDVDGFLLDLLSPDSAARQRIAAYGVDEDSGNTEESLAKGIFVIVGSVRMVPEATVIVFNANVGPSVQVTVS